MVSPTIECPICRSRSCEAFWCIESAPVTCASIFDTRDEALAVPKGRVDLTVCRSCGFVFNPCFDPALGALGAKYESSQAASAHFSAFANSLAKRWIDSYGLTGSTVLEVGCGGGDFLRAMLAQGVGHAIGIDPCCDPGSSSDNLRFLSESFDESSIDLQASALICRHTLEHIGNVRGFLTAVHEWAARDPKRVLLFELPASERVFKERAFWDVYYEHCNYFTSSTLRTAFEATGFEVRRIDTVYDDQYLVLEATAARNPLRASQLDATEALRDCHSFGIDVREAISACRRRLTEFAAANRPLVLWQGASKTVGFLTAIGDADMIDSAIDLSPQRQRKFLPGSGLPVHAPAELQRLSPDHVVLMNPVYLREVRELVESLGVQCVVHSVNDLLRAS